MLHCLMMDFTPIPWCASISVEIIPLLFRDVSNVNKLLGRVRVNDLCTFLITWLSEVSGAENTDQMNADSFDDNTDVYDKVVKSCPMEIQVMIMWWDG